MGAKFPRGYRGQEGEQGYDAATQLQVPPSGTACVAHAHL